MRTNVLLIMCDQMRGDCIGAAGHPDVRTPYLDALAAEGVLFSRAYSACPSCIPARAALFTGKSQKGHGRVGYQDGVDWNYTNMLPQVMANHGYYTGCVGKMHVHPPMRRCGFQNLSLHDGYIEYYRRTDIPYIQHQAVHDDYLWWLKERVGENADVSDTGLECNSWLARPWIYNEALHPTNWAVNESIQFLQKRDREKPFFLMTSFVRPHPPLDAPQYYFNLYSGVELKEPRMGSWEKTAFPEVRNAAVNSMFGCLDDGMRREAMAGYYACITHMDHQIGRLLQFLDTEGLTDNTVILFLSDHGEMMFEHGLFRKALPYQGSIHIPLIIKTGRHIKQEQLKRNRNRLTELRDVMPTVLELAEIGIPREVDGISLLGSTNREYIHGEHSYGEYSNHFVVTGSDKYIWYSQSGKEQYFNLKEDPDELCNQIMEDSTAERVRYLRNILISELKGREEGYSDGKQLFDAKTPVKVLREPY